MNKPSPKYFEIRWVNLDPTIGAETRKKRPCVIIQSDFINQNSMTTIVSPLLPGHKDWPFAVNILPTNKNGLDKERHINLKQLRAVDTARVEKLNGILEEKYIDAVNGALKLVFNLDRYVLH